MANETTQNTNGRATDNNETAATPNETAARTNDTQKPATLVSLPPPMASESNFVPPATAQAWRKMLHTLDDKTVCELYMIRVQHLMQELEQVEKGLLAVQSIVDELAERGVVRTSFHDETVVRASIPNVEVIKNVWEI